MVFPGPLPTMSALRCFAAAARSGSFTAAAAALNLTQSAVSRQVARLEALLGAALFVRHGPRLALTELGAAYSAAIAPALFAIERATIRHRSALDSGVVSLATLPSFGMRWLAPRLSRLTRVAPELVVNLSARADEFDFAEEAYDAAIHFGLPDWERAQCDYLFGETNVAVAAPSLLENPASGPEEFLARVPLLAMTTRADAWSDCFSEGNPGNPTRRPAATFEHFTMLAQAAVGGAGAAILPAYLIAEELADGRLVRLPGIEPRVSERAYYLAYPSQKLEKATFRKFRNWLLREAAADRDVQPRHGERSAPEGAAP